ncbi:Methyl-accepting chemotaxis protein McpA [Sulfitobacter noctilucae]|uniref:methyl-accepting chemotaxis protein n=1 Tax=Sulfitobacter noctilucae TaxID=1342302 RepID=UPI00046A6910|nr:methyl-accepting chemotaxis protein [Sulfitobacter noctilucae]KIN60984.1 Methyl-accepting chemotaxis protein McpA [Sulfitobacter noctilucae]
MIKNLGRLSAQQFITGMVIAMVPFVSLASVIAGTPFFVGPLFSVMMACIAIAMSVSDRQSKPVLGLALIGQSIALTAAFSGHALQIDSHMTFFAFLACLVALHDVRTVVFATVAIALHHLSLAVLFPNLIYPSASLLFSIERTAMHAVIVLIEAVALVASIIRIKQLLAENERQIAEVKVATANSEKARTDALTAKARAEANDRVAQEAKRAAEAALKAAETDRATAQEAEKRNRELDHARQEEAMQNSEELRGVIVALGQGLEALSQKNVSVRLETAFPAEYEDLRSDFNVTSTALNHALRQMSEESHQMLEEARRMGDRIDMVTQTASAQATRTELASGEMRSVVQGVRDTASEASATSAAVMDVERSTEASADVVARASAAMTEIDQSASQISAIIDVIEQIAFQTNLLALNAGVEAARAGDAGRGFAVVASEVRALAQRSSDAAQNISELIIKSQKHVKLGVKHVSDTVGSLHSVKSGVEAISERMQTIASRSLQQADVIGGISDTIQTVERESKQSAVAMDTMAKDTQRLTQRAGDLMCQSAEFVTEGGSTIPPVQLHRRSG